MLPIPPEKTGDLERRLYDLSYKGVTDLITKLVWPVPALWMVRQCVRGVPIGVALDMHTNFYPAIGEHATVVAGYQTYPHIDMYETGLRAGRATLALLAGRAKPAMAWGQRPMLPHVMRQGSDDEPNRTLQARCKAIEAAGALSASVFVGFPNADIVNAGLSAVVVADGDPAKARAWCDELLELAWSRRAEFVYRPEPLADSIARARTLTAAKPPRCDPVELLGPRALIYLRLRACGIVLHPA